MNELVEQQQYRLFRFRTPDLTCEFALPVQWTAGVARIPFVTRIPFTPPSVLGVGRWLEQPVSILDLGLLINTDRAVAHTAKENGLYLIVREPDGRSLAGWPIAAGAESVLVKPKMPGAAMPADIRHDAAHVAISIGSEPVVILNPVRLFSGIV